MVKPRSRTTSASNIMEADPPEGRTAKDGQEQQVNLLRLSQVFSPMPDESATTSTGVPLAAESAARRPNVSQAFTSSSLTRATTTGLTLITPATSVTQTPLFTQLPTVANIQSPVWNVAVNPRSLPPILAPAWTGVIVADLTQNVKPATVQGKPQQRLVLEAKDPESWTVDEVTAYIKTFSDFEEYAEVFSEQLIDGKALFLLKEHHLISATGMKLGPALKICAMIRSLHRGHSGRHGSLDTAPQ